MDFYLSNVMEGRLMGPIDVRVLDWDVVRLEGDTLPKATLDRLAIPPQGRGQPRRTPRSSTTSCGRARGRVLKEYGLGRRILRPYGDVKRAGAAGGEEEAAAPRRRRCEVERASEVQRSVWGVAIGYEANVFLCDSRRPCVQGCARDCSLR